MDPVTAITALSAALKLAEVLVPQVQELFQRGQITAEQQQELMARFEALKKQGQQAFQGAEWNLSLPK